MQKHMLAGTERTMRVMAASLSCSGVLPGSLIRFDLIFPHWEESPIPAGGGVEREGRTLGESAVMNYM